jgi:hypothetical protein
LSWKRSTSWMADVLPRIRCPKSILTPTQPGAPKRTGWAKPSGLGRTFLGSVDRGRQGFPEISSRSAAGSMNEQKRFTKNSILGRA